MSGELLGAAEAIAERDQLVEHYAAEATRNLYERKAAEAALADLREGVRALALDFAARSTHCHRLANQGGPEARRLNGKGSGLGIARRLTDALLASCSGEVTE